MRISGTQGPVTPPAKTARAVRTRTQILESAAMAYAEDGVRGSSIESIAQRAGVTKPTVYAHFASKEELFQAVVLDARHLIRSPVWEPYSADADMGQQLFVILDRYFALILEPEKLRLYRAISNEYGMREEHFPKRERPLHRELARWLLAASQCNEICEDKLMHVAELFMAMLMGTLFFPAMIGLDTEPDTRTRRRKLRQSITFLMRALRPEC